MSKASWLAQKAAGKITHHMPYRLRKAKNAWRKAAQRQENIARRRANGGRPNKAGA